VAFGEEFLSYKVVNCDSSWFSKVLRLISEHGELTGGQVRRWLQDGCRSS